MIKTLIIDCRGEYRSISFVSICYEFKMYSTYISFDISKRYDSSFINEDFGWFVAPEPIISVRGVIENRHNQPEELPYHFDREWRQVAKSEYSNCKIAIFKLIHDDNFLSHREASLPPLYLHLFNIHCYNYHGFTFAAPQMEYLWEVCQRRTRGTR